MTINFKSAGSSPRKLLSRAEALVIGGVFLAALFVIVLLVRSHPTESVVCQIFYKNQLAQTVSLDKDQIFHFSQNPAVVFQVKDGAIAFVASDCPDKICVKTGFISHPGQMAACLPNHVVIKIVETGPAPTAGGEPDVIIR